MEVLVGYGTNGSSQTHVQRCAIQSVECQDELLRLPICTISSLINPAHLDSLKDSWEFFPSISFHMLYVCACHTQGDRESTTKNLAFSLSVVLVQFSFGMKKNEDFSTSDRSHHSFPCRRKYKAGPRESSPLIRATFNHLRHIKFSERRIYPINGLKPPKITRISPPGEQRVCFRCRLIH